MKKYFTTFLVVALTLVTMSCSIDPTPPFAGMTGYAYYRADYPSIYMNKVSISSDGKYYTNLGNYLTNNTPVTSQIVSWTAGTMTIYNAVYGTATCNWTTDQWGIVIFLD